MKASSSLSAEQANDPYVAMVAVQRPVFMRDLEVVDTPTAAREWETRMRDAQPKSPVRFINPKDRYKDCLLYTSPSPRDATLSRMPSSA